MQSTYNAVEVMKMAESVLRDRAKTSAKRLRRHSPEADFLHQHCKTKRKKSRKAKPPYQKLRLKEVLIYFLQRQRIKTASISLPQL